MKKLLLTLSFLSIYLIGTAQEKFTQATMQQIIDEYKADSKAFFINRLSDDFRFTPPTGEDYIGKSTVVSWSKSDILKVEMLETKIFTSGDLAIVSGIIKDEKVGKNPELSKVTFTFQNRGGKWLFVASQYAPQPIEKFTKATWQQMLDEYKANSKVFFTNRLSDDFRYMNPEGKFGNKNQIVEQNTQQIISTEMLEPVILNSGNLAILSGIHQTIREGKDGKPTTGRVNASYTFQNRGGKWFFVASQQTTNTTDK